MSAMWRLVSIPSTRPCRGPASNCSSRCPHLPTLNYGLQITKPRGVQIGASDFETYATMTEGLEIVSRVIVQVAEVEKAIPIYKAAALGTGLSRTIVDVYVKVLTFLATARRFFDKNTGGTTDPAFPPSMTAGG